MRRYKPVRAVARLLFDASAQAHAYRTVPSAAAAFPVRKETADEQRGLSVEYKRRIQEMYQAAAHPGPVTQPFEAQHDPQRSWPSLAEVADRLNSSKDASCSSSASMTDSNTGVDWREALARLQAAEKQQLQEGMLTDTFRCCPSYHAWRNALCAL